MLKAPLFSYFVLVGLLQSISLLNANEELTDQKDCSKVVGALSEKAFIVKREPHFFEVKEELKKSLAILAPGKQYILDGKAAEGIERSLYLTTFYRGRLEVNHVAMAITHPTLAHSSFPKMKLSYQYNFLIRALAGLIDADTRAFAFFHADDFKNSHPELSKFLKDLADSNTDEMKLKSKENSVSFLWYPRYPEGHTSCTHTKIIVDGKVWGTMNNYIPFTSEEAHRILARKSLKNTYFKFNILASREDLERLNYLLNINDRRGTSLGTCVAGTCGALRESGIVNIPLPFNQIPSLAALYLTILKQFPKSKVFSISYHGKSALNSILSADILVDGAVIGSMTLLATAPIWLQELNEKQAKKNAAKTQERYEFFLKYEKMNKENGNFKAKDWKFENYILQKETKKEFPKELGD